MFKQLFEKNHNMQGLGYNYVIKFKVGFNTTFKGNNILILNNTFYVFRRWGHIYAFCTNGCKIN